MTSRERLEKALNHKPVDRVPVDFGGTAVTGIHVSVVSKLRKAFLGEDDYRVRVIEPFQMLGEIDDKLSEALALDVAAVMSPKTMFGFTNENWKPFTLFDGTEVLVPGQFNVTVDDNGDLLLYPEGDTSARPSGRMPRGGNFFDAICRQEPIVEDELDPADNLEEFGLLSEEDITFLASQARNAASNGKGTVLSVPGTSFGDIAFVPATGLKRTKGIRDVEEWYVSTISRKEYVLAVFEAQCEIALRNLDRLVTALGDNIQVAFTTGADFGTQNGLFISPAAYRSLYQPFHKVINDFIHKHTNWRVFIHSCGSVIDLIPDFIESGFDILNPVQCSAAGMSPEKLKQEFGKDITFWGGGVDTQRTLPFGTPEEVYKQVRQRIDIFNQGGGFVFNTIHNVQAQTPIDNLLAMFKAIKDSYS